VTKSNIYKELVEDIIYHGFNRLRSRENQHDSLMRPAFDAGIALTRLDERISRSPVGPGWVERSHFADACASLCIDGELVHLEDLVLHDDTRDIRTPTREFTIARDVLRTRRRIAAQSADWALSPEGIRTLRQTSENASTGTEPAEAASTVRSADAINLEGRGKKSMKPKGCPASIMQPSTRCSPVQRRRSRVPHGLAALIPANETLSFMILTGTKMPGSISGALCCVRPNTCR
jgi:hypothetical protein